MAPSALRLPYAEPDVGAAMRRDALATGRRLGVGREAMLDRARPPGPRVTLSATGISAVRD